MKCPLLTAGFLSKEKWKEEVKVDCLKEECAWWNTGYKCCQLVELTRALSNIEFHLKEIKEKMPHLEQFKRP